MSEYLPKIEQRHLTPSQISRLAIKEYIGQGKVEDLHKRWRLYEFARDPMDYYAEAYEELQPDLTDSILDVGCSSGSGLTMRRAANKHSGTMIGMDIDYGILHAITDVDRVLGVSERRGVDFLTGDAESIPLRDNSVDHTLSMFMIYHLAEPLVGLREITRVTRTEGGIAIATSGRLNKMMHRRFEVAIARFLGVEPPAQFSSGFNTELAKDVLPLFMKVNKTVTHDDEMIITPDRYDDYVASIGTLRKHCSPVPSLESWLEAVESVVKPVLQANFDDQGYFSDWIDRTIFICQNSCATKSCM